MMKTLTIILILTSVTILHSQTLKKVASPNLDEVQQMERFGNEGFVVGGYHNDSLALAGKTLRSLNKSDTITSNGKSRDVYLAHMNSNFELKWLKSFGGLGFSGLTNLNTNNNNSILMTASFFSRFIVNQDTLGGKGVERAFALVNLDSNGNKNWSSLIKGPKEINLQGTAIRDNNEAFASGYTQDSIQISNRWYKESGSGFFSFLVKYNADGTPAWVKTFENSVFLYDLALSKDHLYLSGLANEDSLVYNGKQLLEADTGTRAFILKLNNNFTKVWDKTGFVNNYLVRNIAYDKSTQSLSVAGFFINYMKFEKFELQAEGFGNNQDDTDKFLFKVDENGEPIFSKSFGAPNTDERSANVHASEGKTFFRTKVENGSVLFNDSIQTSGRSEGWLGLIDKDGRLLNSIMPEAEINLTVTRFSDVIQLADTTFIGGSFVGPAVFNDSTFNSEGGNDGFIWKIPNFTSGSSGIRQVKSGKRSPIKVYPNPTSGKLILNNRQNTQTQPVTLYNSQGQPVKQGVLAPGTNTWHLDLPSGLYFLRLNGEDGASGAKRIIVK